MLVVPPHAAARVPVSKVSEASVPPNGICMWVCASMPPGDHVLARRVDHGVDVALDVEAEQGRAGREHRGDGLSVDQHIGGGDAGRVDDGAVLDQRLHGALLRLFVLG